jgi:hypothetical protein
MTERVGEAPVAQDALRLLGFSDVEPQAAAAGVTRIAAKDYAAASAWAEAFAGLAERALAPNPFQSPAAVAAALAQGGGLEVLAVHDGPAPGATLIGLWALRPHRSPWTAGALALQSPLWPGYAPLSAPLLDVARAPQALAALMRHLAVTPGGPRLIDVPAWPLSLNRWLPLGVRLSITERWERALMVPGAGLDAEGYLKAAMGSGFKKREAQARALGKRGAVTHTTLRRGETAAAFDAFVALEAKGWKGAAGTALGRLPRDLARMRAHVRAFAAADQIAIDLIALNGDPIAIGLVVEAGPHSVFWKTAFDESLAKHSPGVLLDLAVTRRLFAEGRPWLDSGMTEYTSPDSQIWAERAAMGRVRLDLGAGLAGRAAQVAEMARFSLRQKLRGCVR